MAPGEGIRIRAVVDQAQLHAAARDARFTEKRVHVRFPDRIGRVVCLGLHRPQATVAVLCHQINPSISAPRSRPLRPQPHSANPVEIASNGSAAQVRGLLSHLEAAGAPALKVSTHSPSLDDVFLSLTGGQAAATASAATKELAR